MNQSKPRIFGRIVNSRSFFNMFVCACQATEWIEETQSDIREFTCKTCNASYELIKKPTNTYQIKNHKPVLSNK